MCIYLYMQSGMSRSRQEVGLMLGAKNRVWVVKLDKTFRERGEKRKGSPLATWNGYIN